MTNYLNNSNKTTLLFKKFQNKTQAAIDVTIDGTGETSYFNEQKKSLNNIYNSDIIIENIEKNLPDEYKLSTLDACGNIIGSVWNSTIIDQDYSNSSFQIPNTNLIFYKEIYLNPVSATNNAWWFIPPEHSDQITDNNLLKDMIPYNFNSISLATFLPIVKYWNGSEWKPQSQNNTNGLNWLIDYASGILQFYQNDSTLSTFNIDCNSNDEKTRPRISFIKYVGKKGLENFLDGSSISENITILQGNVSNNINQPVKTTSNVTFNTLNITDEVIINGNLTVRGNNLFMNLTKDISYNDETLIKSLTSTIYDNCGESVSLSGNGNILIVSASSTSQNVFFVYENLNSTWEQRDLIDLDNDLEIGRKIVTNYDGTILAYSNYNTDTGYVVIYKYIDSSWNQIDSILIGSNMGEDFSHSLALNNDGTVLAIGSPYYLLNEEYKGKVDIYSITDASVSFSFYISGPDIYESKFEISIALSLDGNILAVGYPDGNEVQIYNLPQSKTIIDSSLNGQSINDKFGSSISLNNDGYKILIGAPNNEQNKGRAYLYEYNSDSKIWSQIGHISGEKAEDFFGRSSCINSDGSIIVVGGGGSYDGYVKVYKVGNTIEFLYTLTYSNYVNFFLNNIIHYFGFSNSLSNNGKTLAIGAHGINNTYIYNLYEEFYSDGKINFIVNNENISKIISTYNGNESSIKFSTKNNSLFEDRLTINKDGLDISGNITTNNLFTNTIVINGNIIDNVNISNFNNDSGYIIKEGDSTATPEFHHVRVNGVYNPAGPIDVGPWAYGYPRFRIGGDNGASEAYLSNIMNSGYYFRIRGNPNGQGQMHFNSSSTITCNTSFSPASDDRLKHNETNITNALHLIRQLLPKKYQKTESMLPADYNGTLPEGMNYMVEAGFIAQEVQQIPELSFAVNGGDYEDEKEDGTKEFIAHPLNLNYDTIFTYVTAAVQELDGVVQEKKNEIDSLKEKNLELENKVDLLKNKLNELLSESGKEIINF